MLYLIDETRERLSFASGEARERLAPAAAAARDRLTDARLHLAGLLEPGNRRLALVFAVLAAAMLGGFLVTGGDDRVAADVAAGDAPVIGPTEVRERGFSLSLPADWVRSDAPDGAVFAARSDDGAAETTLWVERDRQLDFDGFVDQSLGGLATLGDDARITDRVEGPALESNSAELRAEVALDGAPAGPYRVNLRAAGPYRYYLATSIRPGADPSLLADAELIGSSLRPEVKLRGVDAHR